MSRPRKKTIISDRQRLGQLHTETIRWLTRHRRTAEPRSDCPRRDARPCIYSEAPQTSLPLKALPYWHLLTLLPKAGGKDDFLRPDNCFPSVVSFLGFRISPKNLKKAAFKRQTVKTLCGCKPFIQNGSELEMLKWSLPSKNLLPGFLNGT